MRDILLGFWFAWQALTAPFYPNPAVEIAKARSQIEAHLGVGIRLAPELFNKMQAAGFQFNRFPPEDERQVLSEDPWADLHVSRLYLCSKSVSGRPASSLTDITATLAVSADDNILHRIIRVSRTNL